MSGAYRPFAPRPVVALAPRQHGDWTLKRYWIDLHDDDAPPPDWHHVEALALAALPGGADAARPGVGFLILHRGRGADYVVLGWWARENELPLRVFVRYPGGDDGAWRGARGDESLCVWDLQVVGFERDAYVASYLSGAAPDGARADYLARRLERR